MYLTREQIEAIAICSLDSFNRRCHVEMNPDRRKYARPLLLEQFVGQFLGLDIDYKKLSSDGSILGLSVYADTRYEYEDKGVLRSFPVHHNQVLLDEMFLGVKKGDSKWGQRRFTLAHEAAHQILYRMDEVENRFAARKAYSARQVYSIRELKTLEDREKWTEWQANTLAAALLMPASEMYKALGNRFSKLVSYEGKYTYADRRTISELCDTFEVSQSAMDIRLKELGYVVESSGSQFFEPMEVFK